MGKTSREAIASLPKLDTKYYNKNKQNYSFFSNENIKYLKDEYQITTFLIFGSYAKEKQKFLSDLDIAFFSAKELDIFRFGMLVSDLENMTDKKVDLVYANGLYKKDAKLAFNIANFHKIVFCEEEEYISFRSNALQYYFDIEPMYKLFDDGLKQRLDNGTYGKI